jgi:GTP diphosphokinase / guanosine-3',5'-bis(diphosphate) 3'-diphosphatase
MDAKTDTDTDVTRATVPSTAPSAIDIASAAFVKQIVGLNPKVNPALVEKAYRFSWNAHRDQLRKSGEPFLAHPVAVAVILAEQKFDSVTIAAGLLHDVLEDTQIPREKIGEEFGEEILLLVEGVTKIQRFQLRSREERQAETYRKMLLSMAEDIRVIIIKFADRIHNLRTLTYLPPAKIRMVAAETLDIYAPLAHRLGMAKIRWELEDLAFKFLYPQEYKDIVSKVVASHDDRQSLVDSFADPLRQRLKQDNIEATVVGRPKHYYSIYRKMIQRNKPFEEVYDLLALRVITATVRDCYHALGVIHSMWRPIQERFKDYISTPKSNGYQSLHTTVFGEKGNIIEVQIRTWEMNHVAEEGIAAHWLYKEDTRGKNLSRDDRSLSWLRNIIDWQKDLTDSTEFYEFFKIDLFHAEIFVFTPKGDLISLSKGATVLDFAFAVHTDLGIHCIGAKVDGKIEPINRVLKSGVTVQILHASSKKPSVDWLRDVKTTKARSKIRRWLKTAGRQESIDLGKKIIATHLKKLNRSDALNEQAPSVLSSLGIGTLDRLYEMTGSGDLPIGRVMEFVQNKGKRKFAPSQVVSRIVRTFRGENRDRGIVVGGADHLMVRFAKCCNPIPGDAIVGFVTKGRGISIHHQECINVALFSKDEERKIQVSWEGNDTKKYMVSLEISAQDRPGLLHEVSAVFSSLGVNVLEGNLKVKSQLARAMFKIEIQNKNQLKQIFRRIQKIKGTEKIVRTKEMSDFSESEDV